MRAGRFFLRRVQLPVLHRHDVIFVAVYAACGEQTHKCTALPAFFALSTAPVSTGLERKRDL